MPRIERFDQLEVWRRSHSLVLDVYRVTTSFPTEEKYGLVSQMRRSAVSVPANIAEGFIRRGKGDKARFYNIAQGSLAELRYYFILSGDLGFYGIEDSYLERCDEVGKMLHGLIQSLGTRSPVY